MASQNIAHDGHLDATAGREVVSCNACTHEWYREEHGSICPRCHSGIAESVRRHISIELDNDPRDLGHLSSAFTSPEPSPLRCADDDGSDPGEADINEQVGSHGFAFRQSVSNGPDHQRHRNRSIDTSLELLLTMAQGFGPRRGPPGGGPVAPNQADQVPNQPAQEYFMRPFLQPQAHRTTINSTRVSSETTSVTFISWPPHRSPAETPLGGLGPNPLHTYAYPLRVVLGEQAVTTVPMAMGANHPSRIFSNVVQDLGFPEEGNGEASENFAAGSVSGLTSLHSMLNILSPADTMAGDAVDFQEEMGQIITGLMEANLQSNAAPPATESALQSLLRNPVDKEMLGGHNKIECTICIDDMKEGESVILLPCNHWFHEACVVQWLKKHNTCPICRTPIEKEDRNNNSTNGNTDNDFNAGRNLTRPSLFPTSSGGFSGGSGWMAYPPPPEGSLGGFDAGRNRSERPSRPSSQRQSLDSPTSLRAAGPEEDGTGTGYRIPSGSSPFGYSPSLTSDRERLGPLSRLINSCRIRSGLSHDGRRR